MAEESLQEKTEQATPKKREEARRKGQVARSSELSSVAILFTGLLGLGALGSYMYERLYGFTVQMLGQGFTLELDASSLNSHILSWAGHYIELVGPIVVLLVVAALAVNFAQVGVLFTAEPLTPKGNRISPLSGVKRIFSSRGLVELAKGLFKIGIVGYITYLTISAELVGIIRFINMDVAQIFELSGDLILTLALRIALLLLVLAALDYAFQRWDYEKNLRMTKQEIKEEVKQQEGDPALRARVRSLQRDMSRRRMMDDVAEADVVVTNPTHVAVALRYDPDTAQAPMVVAKGQRLIAQKIKEAARLAGVPLVENKPLARSLFKAVQIGDEIPEELFKAVAEILAFVFQVRRRGNR